ncbi:MAG: energy transducer TonB, partial [Flavobacterium sp.]|nr:energy transducer TonB [Flavobacterium sp.]
NVQARGPKGGELLEKEALRVISKLPKIKPGSQRGKPVKIKFSIPFVFKLQ